MAELAEYDVEGAVPEGQALGVTFMPLDLHIGDGGALPGALEQFR